MNTIQYNKLFSFLWNIATDVLVNKVDATEYKKIILPFIVLRRLDLLLEPSKQTVLDIVAEEDFSNLPPESQSEQLYAITGYPFYNTSAYTMKTLCAETDRTRLYQNFEAYLDGYSYHVQDIIRKFDLKHSVSRLSSNASLGLLISKFTESNINLGIHPVLDDNGNEKNVAVCFFHRNKPSYRAVGTVAVIKKNGCSRLVDGLYHIEYSADVKRRKSHTRLIKQKKLGA